MRTTDEGRRTAEAGRTWADRLLLTVIPVALAMAVVGLAAVLLAALLWLALAILGSLGGLVRAHAAECETYRITGYVRGHHSPWTYDGTSVWTREAIAAASWNVPIDTIVHVDGLGSFRVADRGGGLGARHIDVLVDTVGEAYALTGWRRVCVGA